MRPLQRRQLQLARWRAGDSNQPAFDNDAAADGDDDDDEGANDDGDNDDDAQLRR